MSAVLMLDRVSLGYRGTPVLADVSLSVQDGETVALVGPSGSGKTTVLRTILGLAVPEAGAVVIDGRPASAEGRLLVPPEERNLAVVFQDLALWPHFTVHGNLSFVLESGGVPRSERERRIAEVLARVGLEGKARRHPAELSGGERQRVAIARALVLDPRAVLLDEPLSNLDVGLKLELLELFRTLFAERQTAVLYVAHDPREAARLARQMVVLEGGRVIQRASFAELRARPASRFVERMLQDLGGLSVSEDR